MRARAIAHKKGLLGRYLRHSVISSRFLLYSNPSAFSEKLFRFSLIAPLIPISLIDT